METRQILQEIDAEIARLTEVRNLLTGVESGTSFNYGGGMSGGGKKAATTTAPKTRKKRVMSAEGRARIAAAQKARWAKQKKAAAKQAAK